MNNELTYQRIVRDESAHEREKARRNIDWFNQTVEGWKQLVTVEDKGIVRTKYIKRKKHGKSK